jgi:hypothetical protein
MLQSLQETIVYGVPHLKGQPLKVVWIEFSTLSCTVLLQIKVTAWHFISPST